MSYRKPDTGDPRLDLRIIEQDFRMILPRLQAADTEQGFAAWLDKLASIDGDASFAYLRERWSTLTNEQKSMARLRLGLHRSDDI